jgi:hypothetical protein
MNRGQYNIEYNDVINAFYPVGDPIDMSKIVLDHLWTSIKKENCAQFYKGRCVSRKICNNKQSYCYPIPLRKKAINRTVVVMYAYYCADKAESSAAIAADIAADAAAGAAAAVYAAAAAAAIADAAATAADAAAAREKFYREASVELIRLIDAWGSLR